MDNIKYCLNSILEEIKEDEKVSYNKDKKISQDEIRKIINGRKILIRNKKISKEKKISNG